MRHASRSRLARRAREVRILEPGGIGEHRLIHGQPGQGRNRMSRGPGSHAFVFIFFTVLIDTIGFGIVMPVMPNLIMTLTGAPVDRATLLAGFLLTTYAVMQFGCGPIMGNLSDRFGRRPVLLA